MQSKKLIEEFLRESNAIEGVFDEESLADALDAWKYLIAQDTLNKAVVLETHRRLMKHQKLEAKYKGAFRDIDVYIGGKKAMKPSIVELMVGDWCARTMDYRQSPDAKALHVHYERIHPFVDGNGRTGRMFWNWTRVKKNRQEIMVIKNTEKSEYYKMFR